MGNKHGTTRQQDEPTRQELEAWYFAEGLPAAMAKKMGVPVEALKSNRGGPGKPRGPRPDPVKQAIARTKSKTECAKVVADRQTRLYAYRHLQNVEAKAKAKTSSPELKALEHQVVLDGIATRYEEAWDVPAGSLRAQAGASPTFRTAKGIQLTPEARAILAEATRAATEKRIAASIADPGDMAHPVDSHMRIVFPAPARSKDKPVKVRVPQVSQDDGKRRVSREDGAR